ncbi:MAG: response regulator [Ferruginibacter sp.]
MELTTDKSKSLTVLIIDDENDICFLLSNILRNHHFHVEFVNTITEGRDYLKRLKPDVLFLDNRLPDGYGIDFINYVKREHINTKIIMVTAHDSAEDRKKAIEEGVDKFISKPFSAAQIKNAIHEVYPNSSN